MWVRALNAAKGVMSDLDGVSGTVEGASAVGSGVPLLLPPPTSAAPAPGGDLLRVRALVAEKGVMSALDAECRPLAMSAST